MLQICTNKPGSASPKTSRRPQKLRLTPTLASSSRYAGPSLPNINRSYEPPLISAPESLILAHQLNGAARQNGTARPPRRRFMGAQALIIFSTSINTNRPSDPHRRASFGLTGYIAPPVKFASRPRHPQPQPQAIAGLIQPHRINRTARQNRAPHPPQPRRIGALPNNSFDITHAHVPPLRSAPAGPVWSHRINRAGRQKPAPQKCRPAPAPAAINRRAGVNRYQGIHIRNSRVRSVPVDLRSEPMHPIPAQPVNWCLLRLCENPGLSGLGRRYSTYCQPNYHPTYVPSINTRVLQVYQ
ncbi:hypothetical protein C8J57DRAFT_1522736 [Mycena rebaudengoi]|nr:hypothetical protein C8J57DRAFT_1522736 [Mycena rebaudengoi]